MISARSMTEVQLTTIFSRFAKDESGATAVEYGLIAALISVVIIAALRGIGTKVNATFTSVGNGISSN
jgi:pilus assembly protein Flp/PilA